MSAPPARPRATLPAPVAGDLGAVAAAHPLATGAGVATLDRGGSAVDAAIAAQAVLAVVMPEACGLGGDGLTLVREPSGAVVAVNGTGRSAREAVTFTHDGGASATVPGLVAAWATLHARWGRLPAAEVLAPAVGIARRGFPVGSRLAAAVAAQRERLERGGAGSWDLLAARPGERVAHPALAATLAAIGRDGPEAFYTGPLARAIARAAQAHGGALSCDDLAAHETVVAVPVSTPWNGGRVWVQPPSSQGVLLAMALHWLEEQGAGDLDREALDHVAVELTEAVFAYRDRAGEGVALLAEPLSVDRHRAAGRGGPRAYLHTAGVAAADAEGTVVSSLVSVFDDFGSGCYVPEGGFLLNNRAGGFTAGANAPRPGARPVHTLAPALLATSEGPLALATPGADGQVQTLLQVLLGLRCRGRGLAEAVDAPRWRSEGGRLLVEASHPDLEGLRSRGHDVAVLDAGDDRFGAVVGAGLAAGAPIAVGDWRRGVAVGVR